MSQKKSKRSKRRRRAMPLAPIALSLGGALVLLAAFFAWRSGGGSGAPVTPEVTGAPALKADREQVDLGDVKLGKTVQVAFRLTNVGDQPLRFVEKPYVEVAAGC